MQPKTFVPADSGARSIGTSFVLLVTLVAAFALLASFMTHHHSWTESLIAKVPVLAADPSLPSQVRLSDTRAWNTTLFDQTQVLVVEASAVNDALVPVRHVAVRAEAYAAGRVTATTKAICGKVLSNRLLGRIGRDELDAFTALVPRATLRPGRAITCQLAFPGVAPGTEEVRLRIASVEPLPGHPPPSFRSGG